jgi:hypothetical protein
VAERVKADLIARRGRNRLPSWAAIKILEAWTIPWPPTAARTLFGSWWDRYYERARASTQSCGRPNRRTPRGWPIAARESAFLAALKVTRQYGRPTRRAKPIGFARARSIYPSAAGREQWLFPRARFPKMDGKR